MRPKKKTMARSRIVAIALVVAATTVTVVNAFSSPVGVGAAGRRRRRSDPVTTAFARPSKGRGGGGGGRSGKNPKKQQQQRRAPKRDSNAPPDGEDEEEEDVYSHASSRNWIERSEPTGARAEEDLGAPADHALSIDGGTFGVGPLCERVHDALMGMAAKRFPTGNVPPSLLAVYASFAMDAAAKQAVDAALQQSGLEFALEEEGNDDEPERWGDVERVVLDRTGARYESFDECAAAADGWTPGDSFSFVVRGVRAKQKAMDVNELLARLDPSGAVREELKRRPDKPVDFDDYEIVEGDGDDAVPDFASLAELAADNERRCDEAPTAVSPPEDDASFDDGVSVLRWDELFATDDLFVDDPAAVNFLMRSLDDKRCVVVDVGEDRARVLRDMWRATEAFFDDNDDDAELPAMTVVPDAGSDKAVVGYASYEEGALRFLETRARRSDGVLLPEGLLEDPDAVAEAFSLVARLGERLCAAAVAAATAEAAAADGRGLADRGAARDAARALTEDLLDDGAVRDDDRDDTAVSMSPHRLCRYVSVSGGTDREQVFGAHTDTSFLTVVPVAAEAGLEVYDDARRRWIRPERAAARHRAAAPHHDDDDDDDLPWHCRYLVVLTGELLELGTRAYLRSAVHRVVAAEGGRPRLSAPVLLRARSNARMNLDKYFPSPPRASELLLDCDGMTMGEIHDALQ